MAGSMFCEKRIENLASVYVAALPRCKRWFALLFLTDKAVHGTIYSRTTYRRIMFMESKIVTIPNISCGHCKMRVEKAMNGVDGVSSAEVTVDTKTLNVEWDESKVNWGELQGSLEKIGYPPES
jgi:copper chaperone